MAGNLGSTAQDLINEALGHLGVYSGDPLAAADLQSAFFTLQSLVDGWAAEPLTIFNVATLQFATIAGKQSYAIGTGSGNDWVVPFLPPQFPAGSLTMVFAGNLEIPIEVLTADEWAAIALKSMGSGVLSSVWPDYGATAHILNFWPVPNAALAVNLYAPQPVAQLTATSNLIALPPGYREALTFELALKLSSKFGASLPAWLPTAWADAKARIKAANFPILDARCDSALVGRGRRTGGGSLDFYLGK